MQPLGTEILHEETTPRLGSRSANSVSTSTLKIAPIVPGSAALTGPGHWAEVPAKSKLMTSPRFSARTSVLSNAGARPLWSEKHTLCHLPSGIACIRSRALVSVSLIIFASTPRTNAPPSRAIISSMRSAATLFPATFEAMSSDTCPGFLVARSISR